MANDKAHWLTEVDQARSELWGIIAALPADVEIFPGWNKRDFFAHIAGWEAVVYEVFLANAAGEPLKTYPYNWDDLDEVNAAFVAERQSGIESNIRLECEISRYAIKRMMNDIPAEEFHEKPIQFPWGVLTGAEFARDAIKHEHDHADDILKAHPAKT